MIGGAFWYVVFMKRRKVLIIGGGVTGLATGWYVEQSKVACEVMVLEDSAELGGKLRTHLVGNYSIDSGADSIISRKRGGIALCEKLGIADQLIGRDPTQKQTFLKRNGALLSLPEGLSGLVPSDLTALENSGIVSAETIARIAQEPTIPPQDPSIEESVAHFLTRRFGMVAYEQLMEPLLGGIYGGRADFLSLDATFRQLRQLEQRYGSVLAGLKKDSAEDNRYPPFVSFRSGMGTLITELHRALKIADLHVNEGARAIEKTPDGYLVHTDRHSYPCTDLFITTPARVTASLVRSFAPKLAATLADIPHASSAIVTLVYDKTQFSTPPVGYGYLIPRIEGKELLACTFVSNKWPRRVPTDKVMLRIFIGRYPHDVTQWPDAQLTELAKKEIATTFNLSAEPELIDIRRWQAAMPQYTFGHRQRIAEIEQLTQEQTNLFLAGMIFRGVGIPDCIESAEAAVQAFTTNATQSSMINN